MNIKTEAAELIENPDAIVPELPNPDGREWHKLVLSWWDEVWKSPMAVKFIPTDRHALSVVAILMDNFYKTGNGDYQLKLAAEIRQQTARFGLSNWDRNRMNWTISDSAKPSPQSASSSDNYDPRKVLKLAQ